MEKKVVVLGAGLAGLSCAYQLANNSIKVIVLEKDSNVGGLASSHTKDGFTYDYGPHRFHSQKKFITNFLEDLLENNIIKQKRKSKIYMYDRFFMYPLNICNVFTNMSKRILFKCFYDYLIIKIKNLFNPAADDSFKSWVVNRFGKTLYRIFFGIYTKKLWGIDPSGISSEWAKERITLLNLWDTVKKTVFRPKNPPPTYAFNFYYPRKGGIGRISEVLKERMLGNGAQILLNAKIKNIKHIKGDGNKNIIQSIVFEHAGKIYEEPLIQLMSTIPITVLPLMLDGSDKQPGLSIIKKLKFRSVIFVYLILDMESLSSNQWIYLPEQKFFCNRISEFKNFSEYNAPQDKTIICAEISCNYGDAKWNMQSGQIRDKILNDIEQLGFRNVGRKNVLDCFCHRMENCYPMYSIDYKDNIDTLTNFLGSFQNLNWFGRKASFKYSNMDYSIEMGLKAADDFLDKKQKI